MKKSVFIILLCLNVICINAQEDTSIVIDFDSGHKQVNELLFGKPNIDLDTVNLPDFQVENLDKIIVRYSDSIGFFGFYCYEYEIIPNRNTNKVYQTKNYILSYSKSDKKQDLESLSLDKLLKYRNQFHINRTTINRLETLYNQKDKTEFNRLFEEMKRNINIEGIDSFNISKYEVEEKRLKASSNPIFVKNLRKDWINDLHEAIYDLKPRNGHEITEHFGYDSTTLVEQFPRIWETHKPENKYRIPLTESLEKDGFQTYQQLDKHIRNSYLSYHWSNMSPVPSKTTTILLIQGTDTLLVEARNPKTLSLPWKVKGFIPNYNPKISTLISELVVENYFVEPSFYAGNSTNFLKRICGGISGEVADDMEEVYLKYKHADNIKLLDADFIVKYMAEQIIYSFWYDGKNMYYDVQLKNSIADIRFEIYLDWELGLNHYSLDSFYKKNKQIIKQFQETPLYEYLKTDTLSHADIIFINDASFQKWGFEQFFEEEPIIKAEKLGFDLSETIAIDIHIKKIGKYSTSSFTSRWLILPNGWYIVSNVYGDNKQLFKTKEAAWKYLEEL